MDLQRFDCTIRVFNPQTGATIDEHVLPVDSPDAEHAAAATLSNAASFTTKTDGGMTTRAIAFQCVKIAKRG